MNKIQKAYIALFSFLRLKYKYMFHKIRPENMNHYVVLLNTAEGSDNLGDEIIMRYAREELSELLSGCDLVEIASHKPCPDDKLQLMIHSKAVIVCGTNFISPRMEFKAVWDYKEDMMFIPHLVLAGVGWGGYASATPYSEFFFKTLLMNDAYHSVRDQYTKEKLHNLGIQNVINTNCITLWGIGDMQSRIPTHKRKKVIMTVTGYYHDIQMDRYILDLLMHHYEQVYFWPQGTEDLDYAKKNLDLSGVVILDRTLKAYEECLEYGNIDYVGSRLHGGIFALRHGIRAIIVAVDNRAVEIHKDTNIPIVAKEDIYHTLEKAICSDWKTDITINTESIQKWKQWLNDYVRR